MLGKDLKFSTQAYPKAQSTLIAAEAEALGESLPEKPVTLAIREVAAGELTAGLKEEYCK